MSVKILAGVLVPMTVLLGVHLMFAIVLTVTLVAAFAVISRGIETGAWRVPAFWRPA